MTQNLAKNIFGGVVSSYQTTLAIEIHNITEKNINLHVFTCQHWVSAMLIFDSEGLGANRNVSKRTRYLDRAVILARPDSTSSSSPAFHALYYV